MSCVKWCRPPRRPWTSRWHRTLNDCCSKPVAAMVVLGTAHPAKFPDAVEAACGVRPALPEWLADLDQRPERVTGLPVDQSVVERHILARSRAVHEGAAA